LVDGDRKQGEELTFGEEDVDATLELVVGFAERVGLVEAVGSFELVGELPKAGSVDGNTPKSSAGGDEEGLAVGVAEGAVGDFVDRYG